MTVYICSGILSVPRTRIFVTADGLGNAPAKFFSQTAGQKPDVVPFELEILKQRYHDELRIYLGNPEREDLTLKLWIEMIEETRHTEA